MLKEPVYLIMFYKKNNKNEIKGNASNLDKMVWRGLLKLYRCTFDIEKVRFDQLNVFTIEFVNPELKINGNSFTKSKGYLHANNPNILESLIHIHLNPS